MATNLPVNSKTNLATHGGQWSSKHNKSRDNFANIS